MNVIVAIGPALTSVAALTQLGTVRRRPVFAFAVGLAIQPVWVAFSMVTHDYGFLIATGAFVGVNAWQLRKALLERTAKRKYIERYTPTPSPFATRPGDHNPGTEDSHYAWQCAPQFPCWEPRAFGGRGAAPLTP